MFSTSVLTEQSGKYFLPLIYNLGSDLSSNLTKVCARAVNLLRHGNLNAAKHIRGVDLQSAPTCQRLVRGNQMRHHFYKPSTAMFACLLLSFLSLPVSVRAESGALAGPDSGIVKGGAAESKGVTELSGGTSSLQGRVVADADAPEKITADLVGTAMNRDELLRSLSGKAKQYGKSSSNMAQKSKDMLNFMTAYKGFERSSEAADVILDEKLKPKSKAAVAYILQKKSDQFETQIFSALTEMAAGLGTTDAQRREQIVEAALSHLKTLVGQETAQAALQRMKTWSDSLSVDGMETRKAFDVLESEQQVKEAVNGALAKDEVVSEIRTRLHKYNGRSTAMRVTAKVVNTTLSIAMLTPNFVSPACQVAYLAFCAATGGPEDAKLLNELYLDQRFQSRWKVYNHNATLAANNYSMAVLTKNPVLMTFSKRALDNMVAPAPQTASVEGAVGDGNSNGNGGSTKRKSARSASPRRSAKSHSREKAISQSAASTGKRPGKTSSRSVASKSSGSEEIAKGEESDREKTESSVQSEDGN